MNERNLVNVGKFLPAGTKMFIEACERSLANNGTGRDMRFVGGDVVPVLANQVASKWIPVTESLPDCADTVLAVDRDGIRATAYYVGYWHSGGELDEYAVTHWMPLPPCPEPPKGE
jgi:hypothetical protein